MMSKVLIEGFGVNKGACGGSTPPTVYNVFDEQTFRDALNATEPRIINFAITGELLVENTIEASNLKHVTIFGNGCIVRYLDEDRPLQFVNCSDVIISRLAVYSSENGGNIGDCLLLYNCQRMVIDHCTFKYSTDELVGINGSSFITLQWCIFAFALDCTHSRPECHSMGVLCTNGSHSITFHHNLFAHNKERNPRIADSGTYELINNVLYNCPHGISLHDDARSNIVGNIQIQGANSSDSEVGAFISTNAGKAFVFNNLCLSRTSDEQPQSDAFNQIIDQLASRINIDAIYHVNSETDAIQAYFNVMRNVGAINNDMVLRSILLHAGSITNTPLEA